MNFSGGTPTSNRQLRCPPGIGLNRLNKLSELDKLKKLDKLDTLDKVSKSNELNKFNEINKLYDFNNLDDMKELNLIYIKKNKSYILSKGNNKISG